MKLIRFELKDEPGLVRSGIVQGGRVYETRDGEGVGMHEAAAVRPLLPVSRPPSVRYYDARYQPDVLSGPGEPVVAFYYGNPNSLVGPGQVLEFPTFVADVSVIPHLAAVALGDAIRLETEEADGIILGVAPLLQVVSPSQMESDRRQGRSFGLGSDLVAAFGPVLTTPEEMDDFVVDEEFGRRYGLEVSLRVNGVEEVRGQTEELAFTPAQAVAAASLALPVREGDVFALGPIADASGIRLDPGDEVQLAVEGLGAISVRMGE